MVQIIATLYDLAFRATLVDILNHPLFWYVLENLRESMWSTRSRSVKSTIWLCSFVSQQSLNAYLVRRRKISSVGSMVGGKLSTTVRLTRTIARVGARAECALLVSGVTDSMGA